MAFSFKPSCAPQVRIWEVGRFTRTYSPLVVHLPEMAFEEVWPDYSPQVGIATGKLDTLPQDKWWVSVVAFYFSLGLSSAFRSPSAY